MNFDRFVAINTTAAVAQGIMHPNDTDSATSKPNAIRSIPQEHQTPAVFRSDDAVLAAVGLSRYFDLISIALKPLSSSAEFAYVDIYAWEIDENEPKNVYEVGLGWYLEDGAYPVWEISPREFIEGWGDKVNFIEMSAATVDEENNIEPWEFSLDDIVVDFHSLQ